MSRTPFKFDERMRKMVAHAYSMGMRQTDICQLIRSESNQPIDTKTLRKHFQEELAQGRGQVEFNIRATAYKIATDPNHPKVATMNIWLQKTLLGINETTIHEMTGPDGKPLAGGGMPQLVIVTHEK